MYTQWSAIEELADRENTRGISLGLKVGFFFGLIVGWLM